MASKKDGLKVIRCTYSELKELSETLEKPRGKNKKSSKTTSAKKNTETCSDDTKMKIKRGATSSEERELQRQQKTLPDEKRKGKDLMTKGVSGMVEKKASASKIKEGNRAKDKNGLITSNKTVRFQVEDTSTKDSNCDTEGDKHEYDRGLISRNRLLYDPTGSNDFPRSRDAKTLLNAEVSSNNDLCEKMERLNGSRSSARTKDSPGTAKRQTSPTKLNKKQAEILLTDMDYLEADLGNLLSRRINTKEQLSHICKLSSQILEKCKTCLLTDLFVFTMKEVYHTLWRSGVYQVIERLRALQKLTLTQDDEEWTSEVSCVLKEFLDSTSTFISSLITSLEEKHELLLKSYLDAPRKYENCSRSVSQLLCHYEKTTNFISELRPAYGLGQHAANMILLW